MKIRSEAIGGDAGAENDMFREVMETDPPGSDGEKTSAEWKAADFTPFAPETPK